MLNHQQDVVEYIMTIIAPDCLSLSACALVCHSFCLAAQRHIFHTVDLRSSNRCQSFLNLLEQHTSLAVYVRKVIFRVRKEIDGRFGSQANSDTETILSWLQSAAGQSLATFFTHVDNLTFDKFDFRVNGPKLLSPLFIHMDRIEILEVDACCFTSTRQLAEFISLCPFVTTLYLSGLKRSESSSYSDIQQWAISSKLGRKETQTRSFEKIRMDAMSSKLLDEISTWISNHGLAKSLRTLEAEVDIHRMTNIRSVQTMLDQAGLCLETLTLWKLWSNSGSNSTDPPSLFDLSLLSKLSVLKFDRFDGHALKGLPALLSSVPSANELAEVNVTVTLDGEFEDALKTWAALDSILAQSRFDHIKLLQFEVISWDYRSSSVPDEARIRAVMPIADFRRILVIQLSVNWKSPEEDDDEYTGYGGPFE